jgi:hypothetical protein
MLCCSITLLTKTNCFYYQKIKTNCLIKNLYHIKKIIVVIFSWLILYSYKIYKKYSKIIFLEIFVHDTIENHCKMIQLKICAC